MSDSQLQEVLSCTNLPSLPAVAVQLLELTSDPDVAMSDIAKLVQQDQALAAKVLKTVNSSFCGLSNPCGSIDRAMGYLGLNTVKSLVLGFSLVETTKGAGKDGFDINAHWRRAIIGATGSRAVAKMVGGIDPEEAFTAALFQDMGMLAAFAALKGQYTDAIDGIPHRILCGTETDSFGFDHTQVGTELATKWKLPEEICEAIRCHHNPEIVHPKHEALARVVSIGAILSDAMDEKSASASIRKIERITRDWYAKKAPDVGKLLDDVAETSKTLAKMFDQEIGHIPDSAVLMAQAQEQGIEHQVSLQRQAEQLAREAHIDGLTQIANRKHFDAELERVYSDFTSEGTEFGVLFFDADKFKRVNDTHGHAAGDAVLIELAKRASDTIGDLGLVCRYGGEEFAVIVPSATLEECATLAEQIRSIIASKPFDLRHIDGVPDELEVTVSIGVSTTNAGSPARLSGADQVLQEADECVYAAKADGRNNVKVRGQYQQVSIQNDSVQSTAPKESASGENTSSLEPVVLSSNSSDSGGRILLVEDDALAATLLISLIKRRSKVDIQWVKSGTKACVLLESGKFVGDQALSLILCDFSLPGCDGHEVLRVAKKTEGIADLPFIMLTGNTDDNMKSESHRLGVTKFIRKDEFCADVNKWLDELIRSSAVAA
jgi:diguanylate cyclase (GGDEF)-like protein